MHIQKLFPKISYPSLTPYKPAQSIGKLKGDVFVKSTTQTEQNIEPTFKAHCDTGDFALKQYSEIACASCGNHMVSNDDIEKIGRDIQGKTGQELIGVLSAYKGKFKPIEAEIVKDIEYIASRNENLKINEIVQCMNKVYINELRKEQQEILNNMKEIASKTNAKDKKMIEKFTSTSEKLIYLESEEKFFKRKTFIKKLKEIAQGMKDQEVAKELVALAETLPASSDSMSAFFAKYSRRGESEIAQRLLLPSLVTVEHVKPQSLGGADDTENYILECQSCNSRRGNMPYSEWFKLMPDMPKNLQKYIKTADKIIKEEKIKGYESYISDIIKTIKTETQGEVRLVKPKTNKK